MLFPGNNYLVPTLISKDCFKGLEMLKSLEVRNTVGINKNNKYVSPSTKDSKCSVSGFVAHLFLPLLFFKKALN